MSLFYQYWIFLIPSIGYPCIPEKCRAAGDHRCSVAFLGCLRVSKLFYSFTADVGFGFGKVLLLRSALLHYAKGGKRLWGAEGSIILCALDFSRNMEPWVILTPNAIVVGDS